MDPHDLGNLKFILSLSVKEFEEWYETISMDDAEYAMELLKMAQAEVAVQVASLNDNIEDVSDAATLLKKFTLKGN